MKESNPVTESSEQGDKLILQAKMLISRIEMLSPDSPWARRSSGYRGNLIKKLQKIEKLNPILEPNEYTRSLSDLQNMVYWGFWILEKAAREMIS